MRPIAFRNETQAQTASTRENMKGGGRWPCLPLRFWLHGEHAVELSQRSGSSPLFWHVKIAQSHDEKKKLGKYNPSTTQPWKSLQLSFQHIAYKEIHYDYSTDIGKSVIAARGLHYMKKKMRRDGKKSRDRILVWGKKNARCIKWVQSFKGFLDSPWQLKPRWN